MARSRPHQPRSVSAILGDYAPALRFLDREERRRARVLARYGWSLFERAASGDDRQDPANRAARLASIDRWCLELIRQLEPRDTAARGTAARDTAASARPAPPILVAMAEEHHRRPWPPLALEALGAAARHRASNPRPATAAAAAEADRSLGDALVLALLGGVDSPSWEVPGWKGLHGDPDDGLGDFAAALLRLRRLQRLGEELTAGRCPLPVEELPLPRGEAARPGAALRPDLRAVLQAVRAECARLRPRLLGAGKDLPELPEPFRSAAVYLLLAAVHLLTEIEAADSLYLERPPRLSTPERLLLVAKVRWLGLEALG